MDDLVAEGQTRGVPIAAVLTPARGVGLGAFPRRRRPDRSRVRAGRRRRRSRPGRSWSTAAMPGYTLRRRPSGRTKPAGRRAMSDARRARRRRAGRPFDGLRILDLGVIVAGGELGRLFADLGAEVIKIESAAYPDGLRQTPPGQLMSRSWALTHRNEYSLGLDLRHPSGAEIFGRLVAGADAVFANFKPGTLASLGFPYERLRELNPRIVLAESSAFGATGPWSARMGYGPLVRATTGVTWLWTSEDADAEAASTTPPRSSPTTSSARITAIAALAALIGRDRTGTGAHVHISQAEAAVNQLATAYVAEAARAAQLPVADDPAVHARLSVRGRRRMVRDLAAVRRRPRGAGRCDGHRRAAARPRRAHRRGVGVDARVRTRSRSPSAPARRRARGADEPGRRRARRSAGQRSGSCSPTWPIRCSTTPMPTETGPAPYHHIPPAELRPAPMPGEHTREICQKLLGLNTEEIDRLIADGVLFTRPTRGHEPCPSTQDAGARRLRPGQPARREPRRRARRPDGGRRARRRRPTGARGGRLGARRQRAVLALPRSGSAARAAHPRQGRHPPATPASAATSRRRWSTRPAWTSRPAAPTSC